MKIINYTKANQLIPVSRARAILPTLIEKVEQENYFVIVKKYKPKAALVNLDFLSKLVSIYQQWKRKQDFTTLEEIRESIPSFKPQEVEKDIKNALKAVRKTA